MKFKVRKGQQRLRTDDKRSNEHLPTGGWTQQSRRSEDQDETLRILRRSDHQVLEPFAGLYRLPHDLHVHHDRPTTRHPAVERVLHRPSHRHIRRLVTQHGFF